MKLNENNDRLSETRNVNESAFFVNRLIFQSMKIPGPGILQ